MATRSQQPAEQSAAHTEPADDLYVEATIDCLVCVGTGREWFSLGLIKCKHCGGTGKRTIKRRLTPQEMVILLHALQDDGSDTDGKEAQ